jgi:fused signal recognition particle receptor
MGLFGSFIAKFSKDRASAQDLESFKNLLIESDIGAAFADEVIDLVKKADLSELPELISKAITAKLSTKNRELRISVNRLTTILIVGVNGTGKTTTAAKLAAKLKNEGKNVMLAAADTFRAAAVDQLVTWGNRIDVPVVVGKPNGDPAAVSYEAAQRAIQESCDVLIIDTAGRLHTKSDLMDELTKVRRVVEKLTPIDEVLFVLDGTMGQNGITQAQTFAKATDLTGIVVTKLDGSTKGGIAISVERNLDIPIKFIGTGESISDLREFKSEEFISELLA